MSTGSNTVGPTTILLGAGASADADIPTAHALLNSVRAMRSPQTEHISRAIDTALGGLKFAKPWNVVDIEALYQALLGLSNRRSQFLAPFVGAWHESVLLAERVDRAADAADAMVQALVTDVRSSMNSPGGVSAFDLGAFRDATRHALATASGYGDTFHEAAMEVLRIVIRSCWIRDQEAHRVEYLVPLIQRSKTAPVWIASLNYDNTIELAAKSCGIAVDLGIQSGSIMGARFQPEAALTLAKLHGSLDWAPTGEGNIQIVEPRYIGMLAPVMIFGAGNKLRISGPYLDMLFAFRSQLERSKQLHVCGYSFRDAHVNYLIYSWLERDYSRRLTVADKCKTWEELIENFSTTVIEALSEMTQPLRVGRQVVDRKRLNERISMRQIGASEWANSFSGAG
jgi:hypothetical protein